MWDLGLFSGSVMAASTCGSENPCEEKKKIWLVYLMDNQYEHLLAEMFVVYLL